MVNRYVELNRTLRSLTAMVKDAKDARQFDEEAGYLISHIKKSVRDLKMYYPAELSKGFLDQIVNEAEKNEFEAFQLIYDKFIPRIEDDIDEYYGSQKDGDVGTVILNILHPNIVKSSFLQFKNGHYREAVFNSIVAVFELIREKTKLDLDGAALIDRAFSLDAPKLLLSSLDNESGLNEQKGFIQILKGSFLGIRNPKAHSLSSDLDQVKAIQYLVFSSLLARRIDEAQTIGTEAES